jgi:hypothetical protein
MLFSHLEAMHGLEAMHIPNETAVGFKGLFGLEGADR